MGLGELGSSSSRFGRVARPAAIGLMLSSAITCTEVTSDNIQLWKTTEKGPGKLATAVGDRGVDPKLRAEAASALVDIGKGDEVDAALSAMPAGERWDFFKTLLPVYMTALRDPSPQRSVAFRDALFSARGLAQPADQQAIDGALLPGLTAELRSGRVRAGRHSLEKIMTAIGAPAGDALAGVLADPEAPPGVVGATADLLAKVGDDAVRDKGGAALVARARRERPVSEPLWRALGVVGGPAVSKFLREKLEEKNREEALAAARALAARRDQAALAPALRIAADPRADRGVRDEVFGVVEVIGGPQAEAALVRIIQTDKESVVRYRAFESLLAVARENGILPGLEAFPASAPYDKQDVEDLLVKLIEKLGPAAARPALVKALGSTSALARMTSVMALERLGHAPDAAALDKLVGDATVVKGFPAGDTIGKQAARVAFLVKKRA